MKKFTYEVWSNNTLLDDGYVNRLGVLRAFKSVLWQLFKHEPVGDGFTFIVSKIGD